MNPHPYDERDIAVAEDVLARIYSGVDTNHAVSAVAVLSEVMVARHERDQQAGSRSAQEVLVGPKRPGSFVVIAVGLVALAAMVAFIFIR